MPVATFVVRRRRNDGNAIRTAAVFVVAVHANPARCAAFMQPTFGRGCDVVPQRADGAAMRMA